MDHLLMLWPELGQFGLLLAWLLSGLLLLVPMWGIWRANSSSQQLSIGLAYGQALALLLALSGLAVAFLTNQFAYRYVAGHSNSLMEWYYRLSAVWGGHEGSMLLWVVILGLWIAAVARFGRKLPMSMQARVLAVLGAVQVGMIGFVVITSNPFLTTLPILPVDGSDLNPLLQDPGLIFHPPMLYMGYVGLAVPFAFALAGLWTGRLDSAWARWSRPWALAAWAFLTLGIALGSWWAYYELGWGGWWFWDPVENASFMPWLAATALLHSLAVSEKRGVFKAWTVLLAILAFALSLLGTFLVRSGVLTSVHAFAADPERGLFILVLLGVVVGGSLLLYALRGWRLTAESRYTLWSRETLLVINNVLLVVATFVVLLGTLYPLAADALKLGRVSVGPPYFNALFAPLSWLLLLAMALAPLAQWKSQGRHQGQLRRPLLIVAMTALLAGGGIAAWFMGMAGWMVWLTLPLCLWVLLVHGLDIGQKIRHAPSMLQGLRRLGRSYWAMQLAHLGLLVMISGIALTSHTSIEKDLAMAPGQSVVVKGYQFTFESVNNFHTPQYDGTRGTISVSRDGQPVTTLNPEKRLYVVQQRPMTEAAIGGNFWRDLYVALGEPVDPANKDSVWAVRIYVKPFVRWLWLGAILMALGGALAMLDRRYRIRTPRQLSLSGQTAGTSEITVATDSAGVPGIATTREGQP